MKEIIEILNEVKHNLNEELKKIQISLSEFHIASLLNTKFDISITVTDLVPENFESAKTIKELVDRLK